MTTTGNRVAAGELSPDLEVWHDGSWRAVQAPPTEAAYPLVRVRLARLGAVFLRRNAPVSVRRRFNEAAFDADSLRAGQRSMPPWPPRLDDR